MPLSLWHYFWFSSLFPVRSKPHCRFSSGSALSALIVSPRAHPRWASPLLFFLPQPIFSRSRHSVAICKWWLPNRSPSLWTADSYPLSVSIRLTRGIPNFVCWKLNSACLVSHTEPPIYPPIVLAVLFAFPLATQDRHLSIISESSLSLTHHGFKSESCQWLPSISEFTPSFSWCQDKRQSFGVQVTCESLLIGLPVLHVPLRTTLPTAVGGIFHGQVSSCYSCGKTLHPCYLQDELRSLAWFICSALIPCQPLPCTSLIVYNISAWCSFCLLEFMYDIFTVPPDYPLYLFTCLTPV